MNPCIIFWLAALLCAAPASAQSLYKCTTPQGSVEYRNSPCEAGQKNAGPVQKGSVSSVPAAAPAASGNAAPVGSLLSLDKLGNPIKALRDQNAPIDTVAAGECRSSGGHYVQGAGCLDAPPSNRNPAIGEVKMREICGKLAKVYIKVLNDCLDKRP